MSRTIRFHKFGPAEVLKCEEHAAAQPAPGEVQVRVEAIGVSWYDTLWRQNLASSHARLPSGIGQEMAGVVTALGDGVDDLAIGDRVASFPAQSPNDYPVYGEQIVLPRTSVTRYPDVLSPIEAAVHYTPLLIAYFALVDLARVKPEQFALVTDASHCAGPSFVQLGKALGVRVIAATHQNLEQLSQEGKFREDLFHRLNAQNWGGCGIGGIEKIEINVASGSGGKFHLY